MGYWLALGFVRGRSLRLLSGQALCSVAMREGPARQIKSFTPTSGPVGMQVTITRVSLTQTTKVTFGGIAATSFTVDSDSQVTATAPTGERPGRLQSRLLVELP